MDFPLVSCIMPTYNHRTFVPQAIEYCLRQDYPHKELILLDDGTDKICDLMPDLPEIKFVELSQKLTVGEKRNLAIEASRGEMILHWYDDDLDAAAPNQLSSEEYASHKDRCILCTKYWGQSEICRILPSSCANSSWHASMPG
jgi:glycosyltransferase involved in cell wall biosynthesis